MEFVQTKGEGFFPLIPAPSLSLDIHMLCFLQVLSALTQPFRPNPSSVFSQSLIKPHNPLVTQKPNNPNL